MKSLKHFTLLVHVRPFTVHSHLASELSLFTTNNIEINTPIISAMSVVLGFVFLDNHLWGSEHWLIDDMMQ